MHGFDSRTPRLQGARLGNTQVLTLVVIVLVAVVGVLLFVNPAPKSALDRLKDEQASSANQQPAEPKANETAPDSVSTPEPTPQAQPREPRPQEVPLRLEPAEVDYGYVLVDQTRRAEVLIHNDSDYPVTVEAIHTACPCTDAEVVPRTVAPRGTSVLTLTYTAQSFPHVAPLRSVRLQTREYPRQVTSLLIKATVGREIRLNSDRDPLITELSGELLVESFDGEPFEVLLVDGREPEFVDFDPASDTPRSSYLVRYDFTQRPDSGIPRYLHVATNRKSDPLAEIPTRFSDNFREQLMAQPLSWLAENRMVHVTFDDDTDTITRRVKLKRTRTEAGELPVVEADIRPATGKSVIGTATDRDPTGPAAATVEVKSVEPDPRKSGDFFVDVEFTRNPDSEPGLYHGILTFIRPDGSYTELDVVTYLTDGS